MIYGHKRNVEFFDRAIANGNISHAYGFVGMNGIGKSSFALDISKKLICNSDKKLEKLLDMESHPDFIRLKKEDDKILINQISKLENFFVMKSNYGRKIALIDDFDAVSEQLQNKLLKLLEEPPKGSVIFLIIENKYRVLPTIMSRLSVLNFNPLGNTDIKRIVHDSGSEYSEEVLKLSLGSMNYYFKWFDAEFSKDIRDIFAIYYRFLFENLLDMTEFVKLFKKYNSYSNYILDLMVRLEEDMLCLKSGSDIGGDFNILSCFKPFCDINRLRNCLEGISLFEMIRRMKAINECKLRVSYSQNEELIFEKLVFEGLKRS